jgi:heptosyltransferase-3
MPYNPLHPQGQSRSVGLLDVFRSAPVRRGPRITLVRTGGVGDTMLILPTLQRLRERLERAELILVGSHWAEDLRPLIPLPLDVVRLDSPALTPLFTAAPVRDASGAFVRADAVLLYTADPEGNFARNVTHNCPGPVVIWPVATAQGVHAAVHLARALGGRPDEATRLPAPALTVPDSLRVWAWNWLEGRLGPDARAVTIHPGSGSPAKCWPAESCAPLVRRLTTPVLLLEGPADAAACERLRALLPPSCPTVPAAGLSLLQSAAILERSALFVGNDSGISHLAAALGVPTLAVFGPTDPAVWAPLGRRVAVVRSRDPGAWPMPDEVLAAADRLLTSSPSRPGRPSQLSS